jgi:hypothetical protein
MAVALAFAATASFGTGDFIAGLVSRRIPPLAVDPFAQWVGLALLLVLSRLVRSSPFGARDVMWGAAAGVGAGISAPFLFGALARADEPRRARHCHPYRRRPAPVRDQGCERPTAIALGGALVTCSPS